jgi:predicted secreted protein
MILNVLEYQRTLKENKEKAEWRIEKKALTEKLKTLSQYEADAKKSFQNGYG